LPEKVEIFRKFAWINQNLFGKLPEKIEIFGNFLGQIDFLPGSKTPQISNQIDAAA